MKRLILAGVLLAVVALSCSSPTGPEETYLFAYGIVSCDDPIPLDEVLVGWSQATSIYISINSSTHSNKEGVYRFYSHPNFASFWKNKRVVGFAYFDYYSCVTEFFEYPGTPIRVDFHLKQDE